MTLYEDAESVRKMPVRSVFIEITTELLAEMMGQRVTDPEGAVLRFDRVHVRFDPFLGVFVAEPYITRETRDADA